jgi:thiol-disulfide isomerase/thioredoxin
MKKHLTISLIILLTSCKYFGPKGVELPSFNLLLLDSTTHLNTNQIPSGKLTILLYFSPDCDHCQRETDSILHNMKSFERVQFYFVTNDPMDRMRVFNQYYKIYNYKNITLGQDYNFYFITHFKTNGPPYMVIYDQDKKERATFIGQADINKVIEFINTI